MRHGVQTIAPMDRVVFGARTAEAVAAEADLRQAQRVFLLVSGTLNRKTDEIAKVREALASRYVAEFDDMPQHMPRDAILRAAEVARRAKADLVVTIGGGSVTDAGKTLTVCLEHDITTLEGFEPFLLKVASDGRLNWPNFRGPSVRQIAVPTTLSGGEFHMGGGSVDPVKKVRETIRNPFMVPSAVILDPALTLHTPEWLWLSTGMRSIDHAVEAFCSPFGSPYVDGCALEALRILSKALPRSKEDPSDLEARADCQTAMWLAISGMGSLIPMGASHGIGHVLGGSCGVPHGYTTCAMLPSVLRYNHPATAEKQAMISEAMGQPGRAASDVIADLIKVLGMPSTLREVGVGSDQFELVAKNSLLARWVHTNPRKIAGVEDVLEILRMAA
ncbi:MAG: maleylacetate reductase [Rhodospirillaceae bacterium]|jgi:maleylacetate reductase|nr:maleylacetate reductase [Rhodospirillaceae bacterium]